MEESVSTNLVVMNVNVEMEPQEETVKHWLVPTVTVFRVAIMVGAKLVLENLFAIATRVTLEQTVRSEIFV